MINIKKRFSEEQIIRILKRHEAGKKLQILFENTINLNRHFNVGKSNTEVDVSEAVGRRKPPAKRAGGQTSL